METKDRVAVEIGLSDEAMARDIEQWLKKSDASNVTVTEQRGILPLIPIVIAAVVGLAGLGSLVAYVLQKFGCQVTLDCRKEPVKKDIDCRIRDGRLIVITKDSMKVEVIEVPKVVDFTEVTKAALTGSADAVKKAAEAAGAKVDKVSSAA
jgi:hypothetical protein